MTKISYVTVFASGEAPEAPAAFETAERSLWAQIRDRYPEGKMVSLQHSTATRSRMLSGLNLGEWNVEEIQSSTVLVTLLATLGVQEEGTKK